MNATPDLTLAAFKMAVSLGVVLAIIWGLYRVARKRLPMTQVNGRNKSMRVLESQYLGVKKSITMVQIPGAVLVLGVSADKINLLSQIDDPDILKNLTTVAENHRSILNFKDQLQRLTRPKSGIASDSLKESGVE